MRARAIASLRRPGRGTMKLQMLAGPEIAVPPGFGEVEIAGITADSREARPGWLFAALPGAKADGAQLHFRRDRQGRDRDPRQGRDCHRRAGGRAGLDVARAAAGAGADGSPALSGPARHHRCRDRHQRQDLGGGLHAPDLRPPRTQGGVARHHRPGETQRQRLRRTDDARSGGAAPDAGRTGGRRRHAPGLRGVLARPRSVPARRRAAEGRRLHQPRPRSPRLPSHDGGLSGRQAAPVHRAAAARRRGRRQYGRRTCRRGHRGGAPGRAHRCDRRQGRRDADAGKPRARSASPRACACATAARPPKSGFRCSAPTRRPTRCWRQVSSWQPASRPIACCPRCQSSKASKGGSRSWVWRAAASSSSTTRTSPMRWPPR